jgi:Lrp/AsnC family transcriptional regulator, leucine-responsive regulatory protein
MCATLQSKSRLDRIDWRILNALQEDCRHSFSALGRLLGLSAPTVAARVRRMEDAGIILGYRVSLAPEKLGYGITAMIRISAPEENCIRLGALIRSLPCVIESYRVTGTDRTVVKVVAPSVEELDDAVRQLSHHGTVTVAVILSYRTNAIRPSKSSSNDGPSLKNQGTNKRKPR